MTSARKVVLCLALLFCIALSAEARKQAAEQSLMQGPVWSDTSDGFNLLNQRLAINLNPGRSSAEGALVLNLVRGRPEAETVVLLENGTRVKTVAIFDTAAVWQRSDGRILIDVPEEFVEAEFQLTVSFEILGGLHRRTDASGWTAVWTSSDPGPWWLPTRVSPFDSFSADLRVFVPAGWEAVHSLESASVLPHDVGFAAWKTSEVAFEDSSSDSRLVMLADVNVDQVQPDALGQALLQELHRVQESMSALLRAEFEAPELLLATDAEDAVESFGSFSVLDALPSLEENDVFQRWRQTERWIQLLIFPHLKSLPSTDVWLREALPAYLAAELIGRSDGPGAFGMVMESIRTEYLEETSRYLRPLVWDRWELAVDMLDDHSRGKGAWVLHMLRSITDDDRAFFAGVQGFLSRTSDQDLIDSEALRLELESSTRQDLASFFDVWIYGAGHPELAVSYEHDGQAETTRVRLLQTQEGEFVPAAFPFSLSLQFATLTGAGSETVRVNSADVTVTLETGLRPSYVYPDARAQVLLDLEPALSVDEVVSQLRHAESAESRVRALALLARAEPSPHIMLALRPVLEAEEDPSVLVAAAHLLGVMQSATSAERALLDLAKHDNAMVRAAAIAELASGPGSAAAADVALEAANSGDNAYVLAGAVDALVQLRPDMAWAVVESALVTPSSGDRVRQTALRTAAHIQGSDQTITREVSRFLDLRYLTDTRIQAAMTLANRDALSPAVRRRVETWLGADQAALRRAALDLMERGEVQLPPADEFEHALLTEPVGPLRRRMQALKARR